MMSDLAAMDVGGFPSWCGHLTLPLGPVPRRGAVARRGYPTPAGRPPILAARGPTAAQLRRDARRGTPRGRRSAPVPGPSSHARALSRPGPRASRKDEEQRRISGVDEPVTKSGFIPSNSAIPPNATRKPDITSSKIRSTPLDLAKATGDPGAKVQAGRAAPRSAASNGAGWPTRSHLAEQLSRTSPDPSRRTGPRLASRNR